MTTIITTRGDITSRFPESPTWADEVDLDDLGGPDEWLAFTTVLASFSPALHHNRLTRDQELRVLGWQYNVQQGDIAARTPCIEVMTARIDGEAGGHTALILTADDATKLIGALAEALAKLGHTREADIRKAGTWVVEHATEAGR